MNRLSLHRRLAHLETSSLRDPIEGVDIAAYARGAKHLAHWIASGYVALPEHESERATMIRAGWAVFVPCAIESLLDRRLEQPELVPQGDLRVAVLRGANPPEVDEPTVVDGHPTSFEPPELPPAWARLLVELNALAGEIIQPIAPPDPTLL